MNVSITVSGVDETRDAIFSIIHGFMDALRDALDEAKDPILDSQEFYPPEVPGSSYVRTYFYQDSIDYDFLEEGDVAILMTESAAPYAVYLRGYNDGSYMGAEQHVGRWASLVQIIQTVTPRVIEIVQNHIEYFVDQMMGR